MKHVTTKTCSGCNTPKPTTEFYSGYGKCKECVCARVKAYREANIEKVREYDRNRPNHRERSIACTKRNRERYHKDQEFKQTVLEHSAAWRETNKLKRQAHIIVGNAMRCGKLKRLPCEVCRTTKEVHAHHEDYREPLDVRWLCREHHAARHREINEAIRNGEVWSHKGF